MRLGVESIEMGMTLVMGGIAGWWLRVGYELLMSWVESRREGD